VKEERDGTPPEAISNPAVRAWAKLSLGGLLGQVWGEKQSNPVRWARRAMSAAEAAMEKTSIPAE